MKRPFFTTPKGQRLAMHLSNLLSVLLLVALALHTALVEAPKAIVSQLDSGNIQHCVVLECGKLSDLAGLEPVKVTITEGEFINTVRVDFVNHGRLDGTRDLRLELRDGSGKFLEAASGQIRLGLVGRNYAEFGLTHSISSLEAGRLLLGY